MALYIEHDVIDDVVDPPLFLEPGPKSGVGGNFENQGDNQGYNGHGGANFVNLDEEDGVSQVAEGLNEQVNVQEGVGEAFSIEVEDLGADEGLADGLGEIPVDLVDEYEDFLHEKGIKKGHIVRTRCLSDGEGDEELEKSRELAHRAAGRAFRLAKKKAAAEGQDDNQVPVFNPPTHFPDPEAVVGGFEEREIGSDDRGLKRALSEELPRTEHRNCARHVFANWSGKALDRSYEQAYLQIVKAGTEPEWQALQDELIAKNDVVGKELFAVEKEPRAWTKAFF
ncbi:hypothetical protein COLO4_19871 [Corchorus olitorius]|uniref:Uncharacterized protein n=1 Tax=Corchorus olitorius TaxID=93759 RepID=A0A1R3J2X6_9ROSI|nr:hypothetical protein COLO4_19871 [Corchorus olitorius]